MSYYEFLLLIVFVLFTGKFITTWYQVVWRAWPVNRMKLTKSVLGLLPLFSAIIILYTLKELASFDVVNSFSFILFYLFFGYTWIYVSLKGIFVFFDLSWSYDAVNLNNKAALLSITGSILGVTLIYSGANVGDGPGWWCVLFAGGLGLLTWFLLGRCINRFANVFERITIGRDVSCGIRFGFYALASGMILGKASSGDWTSFSMTVNEFLIGWPVILLAVLVIGIERFLFLYKVEGKKHGGKIFFSIIIGIVYIIIALICVLEVPFIEILIKQEAL